MKNKILLSLVSAAAVATSSAAVYTTDFESPTFTTFPSLQIAGQDGWTISESTTNISFVTDIGLGQALGLGGYIQGPVNNEVSLSQGYVESVGRISASFDFAIIDSTDLFPDRDTFGFSLDGSSGSLFKVFFTPVGQTGSPDADTDAIWAAYYSVLNGAPESLGFGVVEGGLYSLNFALTGTYPDPLNITTTQLQLTFNDGTTNYNRSGTLALNPQLSTTGVSVVWETTNGAALAGDNFIGLDNLNVVPEPSSSLLLALTGLGLAARRRRA